MEMEHVNCVLCGSESDKPFVFAKNPDNLSDEIFKAVKCNKCGFVYLNPRPIPTEMSRFYFEKYYGKSNFIFDLLSKISLSFRRLKIEKFKKKGRLLDIGCGDGKFLNEMFLKGWECYGIETSEVGFNLSSRLKGIKIFNDFEETNFPTEYFDIISLWQVLEHVPDPNEMLNKIYNLLKGDGVLIISVPNIDSLQFEISKGMWFHLDLPRHLYHYTPYTLTKILEKGGYKVLKIEYYSLDYDTFGFVQSILNLIRCNFNFMYRVIKNRRRLVHKSFLGDAYTLIATSFLILPLGVISFIVSLLLAYLKKSGSITAYAKKV